MCERVNYIFFYYSQDGHAIRENNKPAVGYKAIKSAALLPRGCPLQYTRGISIPPATDESRVSREPLQRTTRVNWVWPQGTATLVTFADIFLNYVIFVCFNAMLQAYEGRVRRATR